jgi:hypothetical protein
MKKFRVLMRGENLLLNIEGAVKRFGFYTTRFVEAWIRTKPSAVESLRQEDRLRGAVLNGQSDPPMLFAEQITEISSLEAGEDGPPHGLVFYEDQPTTH